MTRADCAVIKFSGHALVRMFERGIAIEDVRAVVETGETIEERPDDRPHPVRVLLGVAGDRTLHVVIGRDAATATCYVITCYQPDPKLWHLDFRRRRR